MRLTRGWLAVVALAGTGLVLADTALWFTGTTLLTRNTMRWVSQAQAAGWIVSIGENVAVGWPFTAALVIQRAGISGGERYIPAGLTWSADRVVVSVSLAHPLTLKVSAEGQQFLRLSHSPDIGFTAASEVADLPLLPGRTFEGALQAAGITGGIAGSAHPQDVQLDALSVDLSLDRAAERAAIADRGSADAGSGPQGSPSLLLGIHAERIGLPDIGRWPLGATVARAGATVKLSAPSLLGGSPPATPGHQPAATPASQDTGSRAAAQAKAWRDEGGRLSIQQAELRWGPLNLSARADLGLDHQLQPAGSGTADIGGTTATLDAATRAKLVPPGVAMTAKAILAVMAHATATDGSDVVRLPFVIRDRTVSVGQIPLVRLDPITWQQGVTD